MIRPLRAADAEELAELYLANREFLAPQRVLEKNGFDRIGLARRYLRINDEWRDFLLFQRIADD